MSDALVLYQPEHVEAGDPRNEIRIGAAVAVLFFVNSIALFKLL